MTFALTAQLNQRVYRAAISHVICVTAAVENSCILIVIINGNVYMSVQVKCPCTISGGAFTINIHFD